MTQQKNKPRLLSVQWEESHWCSFVEPYDRLVGPVATVIHVPQTGSWTLNFTIKVSEAMLAHQFFHRICCKRQNRKNYDESHDEYHDHLPPPLPHHVVEQLVDLALLHGASLHLLTVFH